MSEVPYIEIAADQTALSLDASRDTLTIGAASSGERFELIAEVTNEAGELWYQIVLSDGSIAYVYSEDASVHRSAVIEIVDEPTEITGFERLPYEGALLEGVKRAENGLYQLIVDAETGEVYWMVYGRFGEGEALFYLCDENGTPAGEDMFWVPAEAVFAADYLQVEVETDRAEYLNVEGQNTVILTIKIKATDNKALSRGKKLTIACYS